jgi:hypothetical protein
LSVNVEVAPFPTAAGANAPVTEQPPAAHCAFAAMGNTDNARSANSFASALVSLRFMLFIRLVKKVRKRFRIWR